MASPFDELKQSREQLFEGFASGEVSDSFREDYTEVMDQYFRRSLQESAAGQDLFRSKAPFALVAVGGYSRHELCLHSDIDIIILFGSRIPDGARQLSDEIFFPLWNLGLDLGYGIRTLKDCLNLCRAEFQVLTSMMHARFVCGDSPLFLTLVEDLHRKVIAKKAKPFGKWLQELDHIRMEQFGDASYLLEPHLKEGIGGLRDYHHLLWSARAGYHSVVPRDLEYLGILSHQEYSDLRDSLNTIWRVRNHLHYFSERRNDRLGFEYQEQIARRLGFTDNGDLLAVEQFMGNLHAKMATVKSLYRSFAENHALKKGAPRKAPGVERLAAGLQVQEGRLHFESATAILSQPYLLMSLFEQVAASGLPLSMEATRLVREFRHLVDDRFRQSTQSFQGFLSILRGPHTGQALDQMLETGFLDAYIPEFQPIRHRVQHDAYHIYPVGRHCVETVKYLKNLPEQGDILLLDLFSELPDPQRLIMAGLVHDVGKIGKNHSARGVAIVRRILSRMGFSDQGAKEVLFLVNHHLLLAETATRRDLNDEKVVVHCARTIRNVRRLKMLYLLTWADSRATGPRAWNEWTANLVQELFFKILHILEKEELATDRASQRVKSTRAEVRHLIGARLDREDLNGFFEVMSPRYLLNTSSHDIVRHLEMVLALGVREAREHNGKFSLQFRKNRGDGLWEATFLGKDRPRLFSDIAGVMALNNINIFSADIYTWRDGTVVDIFRVSDPLDPMNPDATWSRVEQNLEQVLRGKLSLSYRLGQKSSPSLLSTDHKPSRPAQVIVDNRSSDFFTVIEVFADDRVGLLYTITRALSDLRLDIRVAKIATKVDQVADVFYVRDLEGQKVEDPQQVAEIKNALLHQLDREP